MVKETIPNDVTHKKMFRATTKMHRVIFHAVRNRWKLSRFQEGLVQLLLFGRRFIETVKNAFTATHTHTHTKYTDNLYNDRVLEPHKISIAEANDLLWWSIRENSYIMFRCIHNYPHSTLSFRFGSIFIPIRVFFDISLVFRFYLRRRTNFLRCLPLR